MAGPGRWRSNEHPARWLEWSPATLLVARVFSRFLLLFFGGAFRVSLSEVDRQLLQRCLDQAPRAWQDFVDRFLGLVVHVASHTARARGLTIDHSVRDDLVAEVFLSLVADDFGALRRFRRNCSLATYITVISRRVISRRLAQMVARTSGQAPPPHAASDPHSPIARSGATHDAEPERMENREQVQQLLLRLEPQEANVVRMYHLEGKTYQEISRVVGMSENSIGPVLSRARAKMRNGHVG